MGRRNRPWIRLSGIKHREDPPARTTSGARGTPVFENGFRLYDTTFKQDTAAVEATGSRFSADGKSTMKSEKKMGNDRENEQTVFDVARIRQLIELMNEHELNEIDLRHDDKRIRLRRGALGGSPVIGYAPPMAALPAGGGSPAASAAAASAEPAKPAADDKAVFIKSPMVGTFYSRPKPTAAPYVKVGDQVQADTVVCLVEAMKTFNELPAGVAGKVVAVLVKDEEPIDVNRPLFKVIPN